MESEPEGSSTPSSESNSSRVLKDFAPLPYQSLNEAGEITAVNEMWLETLGYDREEVIGKPFENFLSADSAETFHSQFPLFKAQGSLSDVEFEMVRGDGSLIYVSYHGQIEYTEHGEFVRTHCQFRDVTDQRNTEKQLRQQRDRFRALTSAIPDLVVLYDSDGNHQEILTGQTQLLAGNEAELLGKSIWDVLDHDAASKIQGAIDQSLAEDEVTSIEYQLPIDGELKCLEARVGPLAENGVAQVVLIARDITTRNEQEAELRRTKERFELAIHGANLGVWDWNMETDTVSRHGKLRDMLGYSKTEFGGHLEDWERLVHPEGKTRHDEALEKHISEKTAYYECDYRLKRKDGDWNWIRNIGKIVEWNSDGSPARAVGIHIDIDKQKRTMQELARKTDQLEALNRVVRHDIRNDMNIIHGWAQELEEYVAGEAKTALERVLEGSKHVIEITEVAREFVETMGADETVDLEAVSLDHHLCTEIEAQRETHPAASIRISGEIPEIDVRANHMLSSVFRNILTNAIQHNPASNPEVTIDAIEEPNSVVIRMADNGPGIPDERKVDIFGKGEQVLESEGSGIGLHLVQTLVSEYGGDVWIEDNQPDGSIFNVKLQKAE